VKLGRLARLGERGRALKTQIAAERAWERDALAEQHRFSTEADAREVKLGEQRREWEAQHPGALERLHVAEREHQLAEQAHQTAQRRYEIALSRALRSVTHPAPGLRPRPGAQQRRSELWQEQARLHALGKDADPARLAQVRAELARLAAESSAPSRPGLGRRHGFGPERPGP